MPKNNYRVHGELKIDIVVEARNAKSAELMGKKELERSARVLLSEGYGGTFNVENFVKVEEIDGEEE